MKQAIGRHKIGLIAVAIAAAVIGLRTWTSLPDPLDTPKAEGKTPADFPQTASTWFDAMDAGAPLTDEERRGRNTWLLWTAGDQEFWDHMAARTAGTIDLLKILDSRQRRRRFAWYGVINDPDMKQADKPDRYGLWLDVPRGALPKDVDPAVYGTPSGIVGLRLFPNPDFDEAARQRWDAQRYDRDPRYVESATLVRPYRVGMSCAFCHVAFHPLHAPRDPENPHWGDLSNSIGNQYLRIGRVLGAGLTPDDFLWQALNSYPPGTVDTSFIPNDHINNPRSINSIHNVAARLAVAQEERLGSRAIAVFDEKPVARVPYVLKDGADSIGVRGALARVYVSIGEFHAEWLRHFDPIVGATSQTPFDIAKAQRNSVYWQATMERMPALIAYFLKAAGPMRLQDSLRGILQLGV